MTGCTCRHAQYPCYISGMMLCFLSVSLDLRWPLWGHSACVCTHIYSCWHKPCFTIWLGSWVCLCVFMLWRAVVCQKHLESQYIWLSSKDREQKVRCKVKCILSHWLLQVVARYLNLITTRVLFITSSWVVKNNDWVCACVGSTP